MKMLSRIALAAALVLFASFSNARGAPPSSFVPRTSHQDRATLGHKHNGKSGHSNTRRDHHAPRTRPSQ